MSKLWSKLWAGVRRWWHCLWGMFGPHRMQDIYIDGKTSWIGCECGKAFWWKTDYPPLTAEETEILKQAGFDLESREKRN